MESLKDILLRKCSDFSCDPIQAVVDDLDGAATSGVSLVSLELNGNSKRLFNKRTTYIQTIALCEALHEDTTIRKLDLSFNHLNDMAAQALARLIKVHPCLEFLDLRGNDITATGAGHLAASLSQATCVLKVLVLSGNPLEDQGVMIMGDMLRSNTSLTALDLCDTQAGISGIISVCTALSEANTSLESLDLGRPLVKGGPQDTTTLNVAQMLARNSTIKKLGLSKHVLQDSNFETLVTYGLLRSSSLTSLDLRANRLSPFSGPMLERLMNDNRNLATLDLSNNQLGDAGALSIARCLPYSPWLQHLDLRANGIGEQGLIALAEALSLASHLQSLLLWGNNFGPGASRAFHDTLVAIGAASAGGSVIIDLQPYEVDGVAQLALLEVQQPAAAIS